jgi:hypothetical protein
MVTKKAINLEPKIGSQVFEQEELNARLHVLLQIN